MNIGDRMKENYEDRSRYLLLRRTPVIVRVDGKAFHTYTRKMAKPFDPYLIRCMVLAAKAVAEEMQGFKLAYIQSDEASFLLTDYDTLQTEAWFGYVKSKIETIAASTMTEAFNQLMRTGFTFPPGMAVPPRPAYFDARAYNVPREEVANYFLWRALDWRRNSVSMYCGAFYSAKQMHGKGAEDMHEMLHQKGKNWTTDLSPEIRNGTFILKGGFAPRKVGFLGSVLTESWYEMTGILPDYESISDIVEPLVYCDSQVAGSSTAEQGTHNPLVAGSNPAQPNGG